MNQCSLHRSCAVGSAPQHSPVMRAAGVQNPVEACAVWVVTILVWVLILARGSRSSRSIGGDGPSKPVARESRRRAFAAGRVTTLRGDAGRPRRLGRDDRRPEDREDAAHAATQQPNTDGLRRRVPRTSGGHFCPHDLVTACSHSSWPPPPPPPPSAFSRRKPRQ